MQICAFGSVLQFSKLLKYRSVSRFLMPYMIMIYQAMVGRSKIDTESRLMELRIVHTDDVHVSWKETPGIGDCLAGWRITLWWFDAG